MGMFGQNNSQWARPILGDVRVGCSGHKGCYVWQVGRICQEDGNGFVGRPLFDAVQFTDGGLIQGVTAEAIHGVRGNDNNMATLHQVGRLGSCLRL